MRSLYALHPDTVLQLHERGAVLYGQPLALSLPETEERLLRESYPRIVIDPGLCRTADAQRVLRRITAQHPDTEIAWVRANLGLRGVPLELLVRELRGEDAAAPARCAVVIGPGDAAAASYCALAVAAHLARERDTLLLEADTIDPVYARRFRIRPALSEFLDGASPEPLTRAGWPRGLHLVAAPRKPELLVDRGMEPLAQRMHECSASLHVVVRANANLGDRGLIASLTLATDVLLCNELHDSQYREWITHLAPQANLRSAPVRSVPFRPARAASAGAAMWGEGGGDDA